MHIKRNLKKYQENDNINSQLNNKKSIPSKIAQDAVLDYKRQN